MNKTNIAFQRIVAALVMLLGLIVVLRWVTGMSLIDVAFPGAGLIGLNTPMMFFVVGMGLFLNSLPPSSSRVRRIIPSLLAAYVVLLTIAILVEHIFNVNIGIDFVRGVVLPTSDIPNPGRVAPNTCLGFLFAAIAMQLAGHPSRSIFQIRLMVVSVGAVLLIASTALIGYALNLSALFQFAQFNRMLPITAVGLMLIFAGLWFALQDLLDRADDSVDAFERRITRRSAGILTAVAISTGVAGFSILESGIDESSSQNLMSTAAADGAALSAALESRLWFSKAMQTRPRLAEVLSVLTSAPLEKKSLKVIDEIGKGLFSSGVTWVRFSDAHGRTVHEFGASRAAPGSTNLPLITEGQTGSLVWNGDFFLQTETPIFVLGKLVGKVALEQSLPTFDSLITGPQANSSSTELVICGRSGTDSLCAPSRFYSRPRLVRLKDQGTAAQTKLEPRNAKQPELLRGKDVRGVTVLAAYTPLLNMGLSATLKVDADSLVAPLREHVTKLLLITACFVALGVALAKLQIQPLLAQVVYEQTRNAIILANSNDAFIGMGADGRVTDWNAQAEKMFQWRAVDVIGQNLAELIVPHEKRHAHTEGVAQFRISGGGPFLNQQLEVMALRRDGAVFPIELSITGFHDGRSYIANAFLRDISARKISEQKQADSERFIRTITDNLPALVGYVDNEERYRFANSGYRTMMGIDPKSIIGKTIGEVLGEHTRDAIDPYIEKVKAGIPVHFERRGTEAGRPDYFSTDYIPDINPQGTVVGFFIHITDTSAQKLSESLLRQSEERLKAITDNLPALITHVDTQEQYTFVNGYALPVFGLEPRKMVGRTIRDIGGEALYLDIEQHVKACLNGETVSFEGDMQAKGNAIHYQANYVPELDTTGSVSGFYAITFDVTERKREELRRRESEERLQLITDNLPVLISYLDADRRFQFGNATFISWLGADPVKLAGKYIVDIIGEEAYEERRVYIDRGFAGETVEFDITTLALGVRRVLHTVYVPHESTSGAIDGLYTISTDVTILKDAERDLAALARVDPLTNLPNRRQLDERMEEALARHRRLGQPLALMFIDVDKFKGINDSLGHAAGDEVLVQFASRLKKSVRKTDIVARYAGDEFVIIIDGFNASAELEAIAKKILTSVRKPMVVGAMSLHVTASIGITKVDANDQLAGSIIARADEALYSAKRAGRDRFHEWSVSAAAC